MEEVVLGVISSGAIVDIKRQNDLRQMGLQNASNDDMFCRILRDEMTQTILRFIINDISITITSSRNQTSNQETN